MLHNIYAHLSNAFPANRDAVCIETSARDYTWQELHDRSGQIANYLDSLNIAPQSRIVVQVEKSAHAIFLYLACLRGGYVFVPLNTAYQDTEMAYFIENAKPALIVCHPEDEAKLGDITRHLGLENTTHLLTLSAHPELSNSSLLAHAALFNGVYETRCVEADSLAAILYTSGTTGRSKGAMLSHRNLLSNAQTLVQTWQFNSSDVLLHALPLFHVHGLFVACHTALLSGAKIVLQNRFDVNDVVQALPRCTVMMGVPTFYVRLLSTESFNAEVCRTMRLFISGSAPLLAQTFEEFEQRTGFTLLERYGMSETTMLTSNPYHGKRKVGTVGPALPEVNVRVVDSNGNPCAIGDTGEIEVKGPNVFLGYWQMPEKTREEFTQDGFFKTGDVGRFDEDNYLSIVGRSKDLIISGGFNVYPKEIESYLDDMDGVMESAVIGIPHPDFGEAVVAMVVLHPGVTMQSEFVIQGLKNKIANFKVPKLVFFIPELPRNAMGKVQKNVLREQVSNVFTQSI